ncbi:MAG: hypothetical protein JNK49_06465 [Planctomycetes bacterium]|nr:hypothetical protein [Planctomycetota bacterium]
MLQTPSCAALMLLCLATTATAQTTLSTLFTGGNSLNSPGSVLFDATVLDPEGLVVTGFQVNCENTRNGPVGSLFEVHVYLTARGGTYLGNQANPAVWTRVATGTATSLAQGTPTPVDTSDFFLPAGSYGMALNFVIPTGGAGTAFAYTNGNGANQQYLDTKLRLDLGSASSGVFTGPVYNPRVFNGAVVYEAGTNAAYGTYGQGCSGGSPTGVPTLTPALVDGVPRLGSLWHHELGNLPATPGGAILLFGTTTQFWGPWPLPVDLGTFGLPGCLAHVPPDASVFFAHFGSAHTFTTGLPLAPAFAGIAIGTQALVLDPAATNPVAASATNLTAGRVGN